jgi:MarR family transcriptional regulator, transcriptional regulator for hemolysin
MPAPTVPPLGLHVARTAKVLGRAFDSALAEAGGSMPVWLVLVSLKAGGHGNQRNLAEAMGIEGPTLTHHLNRMEAGGLVTRARDPGNRRAHVVELTTAGVALFERLRTRAAAFDRQLRNGLSDAEVSALSRVLDQLQHNALGAETATSP